MSFTLLVWRNVHTRKFRSVLTAMAIAVTIMTVVAMGVLTHSLRESAVAVLRAGSSDFTIAQRDVTDVLYSNVDENDLNAIRKIPGVESSVGVLVAGFKLDDQHPFFLRIGMNSADQEPFGVHLVVGKTYDDNSNNQVMLGYQAARDLGKTVGQPVHLDQNDYTVVGIYQTGEVFGDSAAMVPLRHLQALQRKPSSITVGFVKVAQGYDIETVRKAIETAMPQLATVRSESDFGHVDRNLELLGAANTGVSALALVIGAVTVLNMMSLSVFERTREFGVLRAIGWSRVRIVADVLGEAFIITMSGCMAGIGFGFLLIQFLQRTPALEGLFEPAYSNDVFLRALLITFGVAAIGAFYPALRAAMLKPLTAIRHE